MVLVREPVMGSKIEIYSGMQVIAEHQLAEGRGVMVIDPAHYQGLMERRPDRLPAQRPASTPLIELPAGPGVGRGWTAPEVEQRALAIYEEVADVAAI